MNFPSKVSELKGNRFYHSGKFIDLKSSPKMRQLFKAFLEANNDPLSKPQLIEKIYKVQYRSGKYEKYWLGLDANLNKLISRTRKLARSVFGVETPWLKFDRNKQVWQLMA